MGKSSVLEPVPAPEPGRREAEFIVDAIIEATLRAGDPDLSIKEIARRAGVGVASIYRYFSGKPAIYAEISRRLQREFLRRLRAVLATAELDVDQAIAEICRVAVFVPNATPELRRLLNVALPLSWSEEHARATFETALDEMTAWFIARVPDPPSDLAARMFIAFSAVRGAVVMSQLLPDRCPDPEAVVEHLTAYVRTCLGR